MGGSFIWVHFHHNVESPTIGITKVGGAGVPSIAVRVLPSRDPAPSSSSLLTPSNPQPKSINWLL